MVDVHPLKVDYSSICKSNFHAACLRCPMARLRQSVVIAEDNESK